NRLAICVRHGVFNPNFPVKMIGTLHCNLSLFRLVWNEGPNYFLPNPGPGRTWLLIGWHERPHTYCTRCEQHLVESKQRWVLSPYALSVADCPALFPATGRVDSTAFSKIPLLCRLLGPLPQGANL